MDTHREPEKGSRKANRVGGTYVDTEIVDIA